MGVFFLLWFWITVGAIVLTLGLFGTIFVAWIYGLVSINTEAVLVAAWIWLGLSTISSICLAVHTFLCRKSRRRVALRHQIPPEQTDPPLPFILSK